VNDEIKFGDNDTLGALVANLVEADALVILTDQKGLYTTVSFSLITGSTLCCNKVSKVDRAFK